jgi:aspartate aminotransferase/aminotransferase
MTARGIAKRAETMPISAIRQIMALAAERQNVIHLELGEPDFSTPEHIVEGARTALLEGWTRYTHNAGIPPLRALIAERAGRIAGIAVEPEQVVVTVGAVGALYTAVMMVADAGDEVLIPDPGWPNYETIVHIAGARAVRFRQPAAHRFLPDIDHMASLITDRTKAIMINTPGNPTGVVFTRDVMKAVMELADRHGLYVISDEIYEDIVFDGEHVSAASFGHDDLTFTVSGVSKSYAMTGWRLGYLVCPPGLSGYGTALQEPVVGCAPAVSQKAAEAALRGPQDCVAAAREVFRRRRDVLLDVLGNTGLLLAEPDGAFYALVDIGEGHDDSLSFCKSLLMEHNVAAVPGITFGPSCDRAARVAFTCDDDSLRKGLELLRDHIQGA